MQEQKQIIAKNIVELRKAAGLTQTELATRINYSDKSISKWERGEAVPDVLVLKQIADLFGVTLDYFLEVEHPIAPVEDRDLRRIRNINRMFKILLATAMVWLVATIMFVLLEMLPVDAGRFTWMSFVYAIPISMIVLLVFNSIWGKKWVNIIVISLLMWSILLCVYLSYPVRSTRLMFIIGIPGQIIIVLWGLLANGKEMLRATLEKANAFSRRWCCKEEVPRTDAKAEKTQA